MLTYIYITLIALMWHRYKMTPRSFKGHFKVKVNKLVLLGWLPRISIVTNLGKIMVKFFFLIFSKIKEFLPLKTMFRYGLLEYCNHFKCFWAQYVISKTMYRNKKMFSLKNLGIKRRWIIRIFVIFSN